MENAVTIFGVVALLVLRVLVSLAATVAVVWVAFYSDWNAIVRVLAGIALIPIGLTILSFAVSLFAAVAGMFDQRT